MSLYNLIYIYIDIFINNWFCDSNMNYQFEVSVTNPLTDESQILPLCSTVIVPTSDQRSTIVQKPRCIAIMVIA